MPLSDPRSVIRIAIALAVLKHKPKDQSSASYLLDLQAHFSVTSKDNHGRDWRTYALELEKQLTAITAQRDADQDLLAKLRADVPQATSTMDGPPPKKKSKKNPTKDQHDSGWSWDQSRSDWSQVLLSQCLASPSLVAAYASLKYALDTPNTDLSSYASRLADATLRALDTMHFFLFSPPCSIPQATLDQPMSLKPEHIDSNRVALASPLLTHVLRVALPALVSTVHDSNKSRRQRQRHAASVDYNDAYAHLDKVVDRILECVLLPLLRAFLPLCSARLAPLLTPAPLLKKDKDKNGKAPGKSKEKDNHVGSASTSIRSVSKADVRTDAFALIGTSLEALDALPQAVTQTVRGASLGVSNIVRGIRDRLGLEAIRELEALYAAPSPPGSARPSGQPTGGTPGSQPIIQQHQRTTTTESRAKRLERLAGTRAERVRALATRDAGWYLASTLNLCVVSSAPAPVPAVGRHSTVAAQRAEGGSELLRDALLDRIGKLVRSVPSVPSGCIPNRTVEGQPPPSSDQDSRGEMDDRAHKGTLEPRFAIDLVCQNMLLAICERAVCQLAP